jgi:DnaJ domain
MTLQEALTLFHRLGVDPQALSRPEFSAAYHRLAWRYHPDRNPNTEELMANINAAHPELLPEPAFGHQQLHLSPMCKASQMTKGVPQTSHRHKRAKMILGN